MEETLVDARSYEKAFMLFGSSCRLLAGKVSAKDYKTVLQDLWEWSKRQIEDLNHNSDVPNFDPPGNPGTPPVSPEKPESVTLPPPPQNGPVEPVLPPPAEKPVMVPNPAPIPTEQTVYISDEQAVRLVAHAYKCGFSEMGLIRYLQSLGIKTTSQIPLSKARDIWNKLREPALVKQYQ
jgi:hypothetical protein